MSETHQGSLELTPEQWSLKTARLQQALKIPKPEEYPNCSDSTLRQVIEHAREHDRLQTRSPLRGWATSLSDDALDSELMIDSDSDLESTDVRYKPGEFRAALTCGQLSLEFILLCSLGLLQVVSADKSSSPATYYRQTDIEFSARPSWWFWHRALVEPASVKVLDLSFGQFKKDRTKELCREDLLRHQALVALGVRSV